MDEDSNERLANVYEARITQIIIIFPYIWKHYPNGCWNSKLIFNKD